jgi:hypothetical protein
MKNIENVISIYKKAFEENGDSTNSVLTPKGRQDIRFENLLKNIKTDNQYSLMDFGCGLAFLKEYIEKLDLPIVYSGSDIVDDFISHNSKKYPNNEFILLKGKKIFDKSYDYIVCSGVFNLLYVENIEEHEQIVFNTLQQLFEKCNHSLSLDFMTDKVDFMQDGAYHQNISNLIAFAQKNLSKRIILNHSYMPYEFTITIFKNQEIVKPVNVYAD